MSEDRVMLYFERNQTPEHLNSRINSTEASVRALDIDLRVKEQALIALADIQTRQKISGFKQKSKNEVVFACIWTAYAKLDYPVDPKYVIEHMERSNEGKKIKVSIDHSFEKYITYEKIPASEYFVPFYIDRYELILLRMEKEISFVKEKLINDIALFIKSVIKKSEDNQKIVEWMQSCNMTSAIIGMICFYLTSMKGDTTFCMPAFEKACYLTSVCINKYKTEFEDRYNS